jgi:mono/diheme cytochrome c family protein
MRALKWIGIVLGSLVGLLLIAVLVLYLATDWRLNNATAEGRPVPIPSDAQALARGEHLTRAVSVCVECHGNNLAGTTFLDDPELGYMPAPNLTRGAGGVGAAFTPEDWERAIRRGVGGDGRALGIMPYDYAYLSDADLGALIAYIQSVPPVDNELPPRRLTFMATLIFGTVAYGDLPISRIDHAAVGGASPPEAATAEYGEYLVKIADCRGCHGIDLGGRTPEEAETGPPAGPDLTPGGRLGTWTEQDFVASMRTGATPDGRALDADIMPWIYYQGMTDTELQAIWRYLESLPAP